jgi:hypothetical protein
VLYRRGDEAARDLDPAVPASRLLGELAFFALRRRTDALFLESCVLAANGVRALLPSRSLAVLRLAGPRVDRELALPRDIFVGLSREGRLFPAAPLGIADDAAARLSELVGTRFPPSAAADDVHGSDVPEAVDLICVFGDDKARGPLFTDTRARAVSAVARTAQNLYPVREFAFEALTAFVDDSPCLVLAGRTPQENFGLLQKALARAADAVAAPSALRHSR